MEEVFPQFARACNANNPAAGLTQWSRVFAELKKDGPFFGLLGIAIGVAQKYSYDHFDGANWGSELLQEHIAFNSLLILTALVWVLKLLHLMLLHVLPRVRLIDRMVHMVAHVESRVMAFGSVATLTTLGFALSALCFGAIQPSFVFVVGATYFSGVTALAVTPARRAEIRRPGFIVAWVLTWAIPLAFVLMPLMKLLITEG
ncbi:MAG: hypothetical protein PIQ35_27380 [Achromobacter xylosoxidans]